MDASELRKLIGEKEPLAGPHWVTRDETSANPEVPVSTHVYSAETLDALFDNPCHLCAGEVQHLVIEILKEQWTVRAYGVCDGCAAKLEPRGN